MDFGIDFGTTNSACTGILEKRREIPYRDNFGNPFPSLIVIDRVTGEVFCGRDAWRKREELSESCEIIPSVKTHLGTDKTWQVAGKIWTPVMVATEVFLGIKQQVARGAGNVQLEQAVVAVPVGFSSEKRKELRQAAKRAGIEVSEFVSEPTAALFCHYDEMGSHTKIGVLDWGGGTLDVSIIENKKGIIRELATGGLYDVGGDMIDRKIAEWCHNEVIKKLSKGIAFEEMPPAARDKMLVACELAKRELSQEELAEIWITNYGDLGRVSIVLDIDTFSDLIRYDIDKAISCFERTLAKARISIEELECIMMVGGSVNLKPFLDKVMKRWDTDIVIPKETDWSVAKGAARLSMRPGSYTVSQTVGVIMSDGTLYPLINAGDKIITEEIKMAEFALVEDCFTANFVFADGNIGDQSSTLGYLDIPTFGFFQEKIILETMVDKNLILQVKGKSQSRSGLTEKIWNYPKLQLDYNLPRITLEVD